MFKQCLLFLFLLFVCTPGNAHAYFDPGTGSILLQALAAGFLALGVFWRRALFFIKNLFKKKEK